MPNENYFANGIFNIELTGLGDLGVAYTITIGFQKKESKLAVW
jgi:hypothetical protein